MTTNLKLNTANWFKKQLLLLGLFILAILPLVGHAQQHPVRIIPIITPPYSLKLADYAHAPDSKLQLQVLMTDLQQPQHHTGIKFFLQAGLNAQPIAQSNEFVIGQRPFLLTSGANITLTSSQLKHLFDPQNINGLNPQQYASPLPEGLYQFCFQAYDFYTKNNLSEKACASVFLNQYDPPQLNIPQNAEKIQAINPYGNGSGILFQWMPRQVAPNTKYNFILKEIWDTNQSPISAFLASPVLWKEETFAPNLYYSIDKTQLIPGRRYAWQVQAFSSNPFDNFNNFTNHQIQSANYKNNGLSEIFFFDYVENCQTPTFLMAKNKGRGRVEIHWNFLGNPAGLYKIQYRKKGANTPWMHTEAYQNSAFISGLEDLTEYEYRVGAVCGNVAISNSQLENNENAYAFSPVQFFTTDSQDLQNNNFQCGVMPAVDISNKEPLRQSLVANDTFTAGDFPVTIISAEGNNGIFSGTGYIQVPYLADTKILVSFNNISINSDKKLISGTLETEYDPEERNIMPLGDLLKDLGVIIAKDNPTDEDKEKYKNLITQLDFYSSNVDDIKMSNEDKELFNRVIRNTRFASLELNEQQKENAIKAFEEGNKLYKKYEKEFNSLKESGVNYTNPNYNNNPINISGENYNLEKLIKRTNTIKNKLSPILEDLSAEEKLILDLPMIEWKLGFKMGAVFVLKWLEGEGEAIEIPYSFIDNSPKYKGTDLKNINLLKDVKYLSLEKLGYTPTNPDAKHLFLYDTSIKAIKTSYDKLLSNINRNRNGFEIGQDNFKFHNTGEMESKNNLIQSFSLGAPMGEYSDIGAALGRFSQRIYIKGKYTGKIISIEKIGTRYTDEFTFNDNGTFENNIRSQDLGCWSKNWEKASLSRISLSPSTVCLQNNDFIKLKNKAKNINVSIGKDFLIYTKIKEIRNENIIEEIVVPN